MFASIRKHNVRRGSAEELARRVREGCVPMMRQIQGFRGYYLLDGGPDVLITISIFDSADEAFASNEKAADWVRNNVLEFTKGMPEVMVGNALIAEVNSKDLHDRSADRYRMGQRVAEGERRQGVRGAAHGAIPSPKHPTVDITAPNEAPQNFWGIAARCTQRADATPMDQPAARARLPDAAGTLHDVSEFLRAAHRGHATKLAELDWTDASGEGRGVERIIPDRITCLPIPTGSQFS